jgi:hypothetical protein
MATSLMNRKEGSLKTVTIPIKGMAYQMLQYEFDSLIGLIRGKKIEEAIQTWKNHFPDAENKAVYCINVLTAQVLTDSLFVI